MHYHKIAVAMTAYALAAAILYASHRNWNAEAREVFHYTFSNDKAIDVYNIDGTIQITGDGGNTIRVEGERILRAEDQQALTRAKGEVKLDVNEKDGTAHLYVNGPFLGSHSSDDHGCHFHLDDNQYEAAYSFTIHVPHETGLRLHSVDGDIKTDGTRGKCEIHGVNGAITMSGIAGYGTVHTINGRISVSFSENPRDASAFQALKAIEAAFPPNLSTDLRLKTTNSAVYTDFETTLLLPPAAEAGEPRNGKFVHKSDHLSRVQIGSGGPELTSRQSTAVFASRKRVAR